MLKLIKHNLVKTGEMMAARGVSPEMPLLTLPDLSRKIWGIHRKKLTVIAARTSNGKSALAIQIAGDLAAQGKKVLFLSLEMYEQDVIERLFCQQQKIDNMELLTGGFSKHIGAWEEFRKKTESWFMVITDMMGHSWQEIDQHLSTMKTIPDVVIIDHVQEARDAGQMNQKAVIEEYLKKFRLLAIQYNFAGIVLSQVNRAAQEDDHREPKLHHLKGTGYLEEGADVILLLHWPYYYSRKKGENNRFIINVAKNRNGRTGWLDVSYMPQHYLFADYTPKPAEAAKIAAEQAVATDPEVLAAAELFGGEVTGQQKPGRKDWND